MFTQNAGLTLSDLCHAKYYLLPNSKVIFRFVLYFFILCFTQNIAKKSRRVGEFYQISYFELLVKPVALRLQKVLCLN